MIRETRTKAADFYRTPTMKKSLEDLSKKYKIPWLSKFFIVIGIIAVILLFGAIYSMSKNNTHISLYLIPLFVGLLYEIRKIAESWEIVIIKILISLISSLLITLYYTSTSIDSETDRILTNWPLTFVAVFITLSYLIYDKKISTKLTEGITLLQSFAIIYYILTSIESWDITPITAILYTLAIGFSMFSIYNAFTYSELTRNSRIILSIWSSIVMLFFASIFIYKMYIVFNDRSYKLDIILVNSLNYFILGVSAIYIVQNLLMLTVYPPDREHFYGKNHMDKIRKANEKHLSRYSENQIKIGDSIVCLFYCIIIYSLNHYFNVVPAQSAIWITFISFPILIDLKNHL